MYSISENDVNYKKLKGRAYKLLASKQTLGCKNLCAGISLFPAGKHAPGHIHDKEEELVYCLEGKGEIIINKKTEEIKPGIVVYMPPKSLHSVNNTGKEDIKLFFVYSPGAKIGAYKDISSDNQ